MTANATLPKSGQPTASAMPPGTSNIFDPTSLVERQRRAAEIWAAVGQRYLQSLNDIASRSILVQSALYQQAVANMFNLSQIASPGHSPGKNIETVASAMEATVESIRDVMTAACKCSMDMMSAIQDGAAAAPTSACAHEASRRSPSPGRG